MKCSVNKLIKIWEDGKESPIALLRPHDGLPVRFVTFVTSPQDPDHIILITGGPLSREVKLWASESEGWSLPSDADTWQCTQTLELKSSAASRIEDAFFNQVAVLSQSGPLLIGNAKRNALYAVHLDYGTTRLDYIAEFTVTMPILSLAGTSDLLPNVDESVQLYCVLTQGIKRYALDLSQCRPLPSGLIKGSIHKKKIKNEATVIGFEPSGGNLDKMSQASSRYCPVGAPSSSPNKLKDTDTDVLRVESPMVQLSPKSSGEIQLETAKHV